MNPTPERNMTERFVRIPVGHIVLEGDLVVPQEAHGIVLFAHGSGSSRRSPRNRAVAQVLQQAGLATLLFDLLTKEEESVDIVTREFRFDIELLTDRLAGSTRWVKQNPDFAQFRVGYFGASTGAAAALMAAAELPNDVAAIVSRGGRPDLAGEALPKVTTPTLLLVGGDDTPVIELNEQALRKMKSVKQLVIVPGATHLFEEPGTLEAVARHAAGWFTRYLSKVETPR